MIANSENTDSSKKIPQKPKRFWLKFSVVFSIIIIIVWLIPYLFSNLLFNSAIKRAFYEATEQKYSLKLSDIKINVFTRKITFFETEINTTTKADTLNLPKIKFHSDTLIFQNIDFQSLRKERRLLLENIHINQLKLEIQEQDNKTRQENLGLPLSKFFQKLMISNFTVEKAELKYKQGNDSIYIPDLNLNVLEFQIDSLTDTVKSNRFHLNDISLVLKNQKIQLADQGHHLSWTYLKLSTIEKRLEINDLNIKPSKSNTKETIYTAEIPKFRLNNFELDSLISDKKLLAQHLTLDINRLNIRIKNAQGKSKKINFKKKLNSFFSKTFNRISIDTSQVMLNRSRVTLSNNEVFDIAAKSNLFLDHFQFNPKGKTRFLSICLRNCGFYIHTSGCSNWMIPHDYFVITSCLLYQ